MKPTIVVPTVPSRREMGIELAGRLREYGEVELLESCGTPKLDAIAALTRLENAASEFALMVEDDALLSATFHKFSEDLTLATDVVSFFSVSHSPSGLVRWPRSKFMYCVCVAMRVEAIRGIGEFAKGFYLRHPEHIHACDLVLREFMVLRKLRLFVRFPSLVQHGAIKSTLGNRSTKRQSPTFTP